MTTPQPKKPPGPSSPTLAPRELLAHASVTPALQSAAKMARAAPLAVAVLLPPERAEEAARKLLRRYPLTTADHRLRSTARRLGVAVVSAQVMPPRGGNVAVLLFANLPPDAAENWQPATGPHPLTWHLYELATGAQVEADMLAIRPPRRGDHHRPNALTWRLSKAARDDYRRTISRAVLSATTQASKPRRKGSQPDKARPRHTRTVPGARQHLERLGEHLTRLPGLAGIRSDVYALQAHMLKQWETHHKGHPPPTWPRHPYTRQLPANMRPLAELLAEERQP